MKQTRYPGNASRRICQVGVLTNDVNRSIQACMDRLGIGPWSILTLCDRNVNSVVMYDQECDKPFSYYCATAKIGEFQIEYMQPRYGVPAYENSIDHHGYCMQHFKEEFSNAEIGNITQLFREQKMAISYKGHFLNDIFVNIDTESRFDCLVELGNYADVDITQLPNDQYRYAPEGEDQREKLFSRNQERRIGRVTVVTEKLTQVMANTESIMSYGPWSVSMTTVERGKTIHRAITKIGDIEMEFVQADSGISPFDEYKRRHGCGLLGICERTEPGMFDRRLQEIVGRGTAIALEIPQQSGRTVLLDTLDELGFIYGVMC